MKHCHVFVISIYGEIIAVIEAHYHIHTSKQISKLTLMDLSWAFVIHETASYSIYCSAIQVGNVVIVGLMHIFFWILVIVPEAPCFNCVNLHTFVLLHWTQIAARSREGRHYSSSCMFPILQAMYDIFLDRE